MVEKFVYVIAFNGDRFVMVRHRERAWEMPGGRLLKGETHEQAAVREFFEETGMSIEIIGRAGRCSSVSSAESSAISARTTT